MEIKVISRSEERSHIIGTCAKFYSKQLKLGKSKFSLEIHTISNLRKDHGNNGEVYQASERSIVMLLDSRLSLTRLMYTLAHEMVHVKQIAKGQYKGIISPTGTLLRCWMGKVVKAKYLDRPWEIEAYRRESLLVEKLTEFVDKKIKKNRNK